MIDSCRLAARAHWAASGCYANPVPLQFSIWDIFRRGRLDRCRGISFRASTVARTFGRSRRCCFHAGWIWPLRSKSTDEGTRMSNRNRDRVTAGMRQKLPRIHQKISLEKQRERIAWAINRRTNAAREGGTLQARGWLTFVHLVLEKLFVGARWSGCSLDEQISSDLAWSGMPRPGTQSAKPRPAAGKPLANYTIIRCSVRNKKS